MMVLMFSQEASAAVARVQYTTCSNSGSSTLSCTSLSSSPVNGNTLIAVIGTRGTTASRVSSITQTGATWARVSQSTNANGTTVEVWAALNVSSAGTSVTVNLASSLKASAVVAEYSGILSSGATDVTAATTGSSSSPSTGTTSTTTQGDELWIGGLDAIGTPTYSSPTNSFSIVANAVSTGGITSSRERSALLQKIVSITGTANTGATLSSSAQWSGTIATFKAKTTTLATDSDPVATTIAPGASATDVDMFTLQTNGDTESISSVVVNLSTNAGIGTLSITDNSNNVLGSTGSLSPGSNEIAVSGMSANSSLATFKVRVTPLSHAAMPAVPGASYAITAPVTAWAGAHIHLGSDTNPNALTIDNESPSNVTTPTASTAGDTQATINYTTPAGTDLGSAIILRNTVAITGTPTEGATYIAGDSVGSDTVACVDSTITASTADSCIATGLTNGTTYYFKIFMKDTRGNYSQSGVVSNPTSLMPNGTITLGNGTDPSNVSIGPGGAATMADAFTFQASTGTNNVTAVVVTLATGTYGGLSLVEITDDAGSTVYGSTANPSSNTPSVTLPTPITTTTSPAQYKIRITPKSHANMPAVPGATYSVTAKISSWTSSYASAGSDTAGTTITIDNLSPSGATSISGSATDGKVTLNWTSSNSADFNTTNGSVIYRWTGSSAGAEVPAEGSTASVGALNGTATTACVISSSASTALSKVDGTGGSAGCTTTTLTNGQAYTYKVFQQDTNGNYDAGVSMGTITPNAAPTLAVSQPAAGNTNVATGSSYNVTYTLADTDNVVTAAFYYDTNSDGVGGVAMTGACASVAEGTGVTCSFNTSVLSTGVPYYVYGVASDGVNGAVTAVSAGTLTVNAAPTLSVTAPDGTGDTIAQNDSYNITYSLADTDNIVTAAFYYDTNNTGLDGIAISGACATAAEGTGASCTWDTTGVTPGSYYVYGITNDGVNSAVSAYSSGTMTINALVTTLSNFVSAEPGNSTIAPGMAGQVDSFGLATNSGTDTVTGATVTLATRTGTRVSTVAITNDSDTTTYCSVTPSGDTATLTSCTIPVTTTNTQFKIKITAISHASMPAVPGSEYAVTGTVTAFTSTNAQAGTDSASSTVTIDNASPTDVTSASATAGDAQVSLAWTNPADNDFHSTVVLRRASSAVADVPVEGTTYVVTDTIGTSTVACVIASPTATCTDSGLTNGTAYHYKAFTKDTNANYSAGVVPTGSPATPAAVTFTITSTTGTNGTVSPFGATIVAQGGSQAYDIIPDAGYEVGTLLVDSISIATSTPYTFTNVQANHTISATFTLLPVSPTTFTITASTGSHGTVSPLGITTVTQGGSKTYTITPGSGYDISTLTVDGSLVTAAASYVFTNVQTNHTISATFTATPTVATTVVDKSPVRPTRVTFTGKAYPNGKISVIDKQLNTETLIGQNYTTTADGSFNISFIGTLQALHSFGLIAKDTEGHVSQTKLFFINTISSDLFEKDILLSPTITLKNGQVTRGDTAVITGYAVPGNTVRLEIDGILAKDMLANGAGAYKFEIPTGTLEFGAHVVRTKQVDPSGKPESDFSISRTFMVSHLLVVKADLNGDSKIDIRDWSIFLSLWNTPGVSGRERIDFNSDGKVDITDFSIFVRTIKK